MDTSTYEMGLYDVTAESMQHRGRIIKVDKNGFFFCRKESRKRAGILCL